jgi:hypothetical protein
LHLSLSSVFLGKLSKSSLVFFPNVTSDYCKFYFSGLPMMLA